MKLNDVLYGEFEVNDKVILELLSCSSVKRLKGVSQSHPKETKWTLPYFTRYDHSVGVFLLLRKLNASLEEQVAGLLHDVSHTAFSHAIDWALGDPSKEDFQDSTLTGYINNSEIRGILVRQGFDADAIGDMEQIKKYALLERDAPDLCADRIDYCLRASHDLIDPHCGRLSDNLVVHSGEVVFDSEESAAKFGDYYMACQRLWWASTEAKLRYHFISEALKVALKNSVISMSDMYKDEETIIKILRNSGDEAIVENINRGLGELSFVATKGEGIALREKIRYIDPKFLSKGKVARLSDVSEAYRKRIEREKMGNAETVIVKE